MGTVIELKNPQTGEVVGTAEKTSAEEMDVILAKAKKAQKEWGALPLYKRVEYLRKVADFLQEDAENMAHLVSVDMAKPIDQARGEANDICDMFRGFCERALHLYGSVMPVGNAAGFEKDLVLVKREPIGVVGCIVPFNFPIQLCVFKIAPALVMGNSVIVKAPSSNPLAVLSMQKYFDAAGVPEGVATFMMCDRDVMDEKIVKSPDVAVISMTGSTGAGKKILEAGASTLKHTYLELGGNDPMIIFDDADLDETIDQMLIGRLENNGQVCNACKRFIVQKGVYDEVANRLVEALRTVKRGSCLEEGVEISSLVSEKAATTVEEQIQKTVEQGAKLVYGGTRNGATVEPAVLLNVTKDMDIARDMEVFGPAFPLIPFETEEEALEIANQSTYGLCGGVMTADLNRAFRVANALEVGGAVVNGSGNYRQVEQPYGGVKQSGLGREGISILLEEYSNIKTIAVRNAL